MIVSKDQILQFLRDKGQTQQADQAASELPDQVDTEQHAGLLAQVRHRPRKNFSGKFAGGLGNLL